MKKTILTLLVAVALVGCKKEEKPIMVGGYYNLQMGKSDKAWHPVNPVYVKRIYRFGGDGTLFCECLAHFYGWPHLAPGVLFDPAPDSVLTWKLPIDDLR